MSLNPGLGKSAADQSLDQMIPRVSIIIPAYNAAETIEATLESVLAQTYNYWEAIVVDDGSTDDTAKIAIKFSNRDARIRMIQKQQGGEASARNAGLAVARYEWLLFLDADDWISPMHLQMMTQQIIVNRQLDAVHCRSARVSGDGTTIVESYQPPTGDLFAILALRAAFPVHACIIRKSIVDAVGGFDTSLIKSPDWDLWQRVARTGARFGAVQEVLSFYRMRANAASLDAHQMLRDGLRVIRQGHAPDPRVQNPHPDHVNGQPPDEIKKQEFYLLCWCAGLLLGSGKDARSLLEILKDEHYSDLYPDAVAQCIFDAAPLPTCQPPEGWEQLGQQILTATDQFLVALEDQSKTPDLAERAGASLRRMILAQSPNWQPLIAHFEKKLVELRGQIDRERKEKELIIEDQVHVIRHQDQTIVDRDSTIVELRDRMQRDRDERVGIIEEQSRTLQRESQTVADRDKTIEELYARIEEQGRILQKESQTLADRDKTIEELYARIERERIERVTIIDDQTRAIQDLSKTLAERDRTIQEVHSHKEQLAMEHHERGLTIQETSERIEELEQERSHWQQVAEDRKSMIAELRKKWWVRIGLKLTSSKDRRSDSSVEGVPTKPTKASRRKKLLLRAFAVSSIVILTSILQGAHFALDGPWTTSSVLAVGLAVANAIVALIYLASSGTLFLPVVSLLYLAQFFFFLANFFGNASSTSPRLLQVALALVYSATALTFLLGAPKIISRYKAALLSFALALALFAWEAKSKPATEMGAAGPEWSGKPQAHAVLGTVNHPNSTLKTLYPANSRGYFQVEDPKQTRWWFRTEAGSVAELVFLKNNEDAVRVDIKKPTTTDYDIQLNLPKLKVQAKHNYEIRFRARADQPRTMVAGFARAHDPWDGLGYYEKISLTPEWQNFDKRFAATSDDTNARLHFDLSNSNIPVELASVGVQSVPDHKPIEPSLGPKKYYVEYRFNSQGCRGSDYAIAKAAGTKRIVVLGGSSALGVGVNEADTFENRLREMLNQKDPSQPAEVINCGAEGYTTKQDRLFYELYASHYRPDVVVMAIGIDRDPSETSQPANPTGRWESLFTSWSAMQQYFNGATLPKFSGSVDEVLRLKSDTEKDGAHLAVVIFRNNPDYAGATQQGKIWNLFTRTVIQDLQGNNVPVLDLGKALYEKHSAADLIVDRTDHDPNEIAHAIAAREIFDFLGQKQLLKR